MVAIISCPAKQDHQIPKHKDGKKYHNNLLNFSPLQRYQSRLDPDVDGAEKRPQEVGYSENEEAPVEPRAHLEDDEYHAHRHEKHANYFECEMKHWEKIRQNAVLKIGNILFLSSW
jgi:hypothetical protein